MTDLATQCVDAVARVVCDFEGFVWPDTEHARDVWRERAPGAMLALLAERGVLRSPEAVDPIAWTIHVEVPNDATEAELDVLTDRVAVAAYDMKRGRWDPLVSSHTLDCVASDHCSAPRPDGPPYPKPERPRPRCLAPLKSGGRCRAFAMTGKDHCHRHGGKP